MPFKGFGLKMPEYEVICPQSHLSFTVRSLTVSEEERMKTSLVTPAKIADHLNKCIYESIVKRPDVVKDYRTFTQNVTLKDRDALLYGLYHITYEDIRNYDIRCSSCKKEYPVTLKISQSFNFNSYEGNDILTKTVRVPLVVSKGIFATLKQPTIFDEDEAIKNLSGTPGLSLETISETLIISKFEQDIEAKVEPEVYSDRNDIIDAYKSLPAKDKRIIYEKYDESFGQYGIDLKMRSFCIHCGSEETSKIDLVENFFRNVYSS